MRANTLPRNKNKLPLAYAHGGTAFSEVEMARMHVAFDNFSTSDHEVHIDDLSKPLLFQDYLRADPDVCIALANEVTPYSTLSFEEYVKFVDKFAAYEKEELRKEFNDFDTNHSGCLDVDEIKGVLSAFSITSLCYGMTVRCDTEWILPRDMARQQHDSVIFQWFS